MKKGKKKDLVTVGVLLVIAIVVVVIGLIVVDQRKSSSQSSSSINLGDENIMSIAWYQTSAEAKALYMQGYNVARVNLDKDLTETSSKPRAIILDIDETILDNSPVDAYNALYNKAYPAGWDAWVKAAKAKTLPGAKSFLTYANSKGIAIYYVSDRKSNQLKATEKNLKRDGLPQVSDSHVLLKGKKDKTKAKRRQKVEKEHNVIMFFGDSLTDFNDPKTSTVSDRYKDVKENEAQFGSKYIVFPNPMYGGWEGALYHNDYGQSDAKLEKERKSKVTYFNPKTKKVTRKTITEK